MSLFLPPVDAYVCAMMHRALRPFLGLLLALVMAATSLTMAVARGQARVAGEIVICTGMGISVVTVDAEGNPTGPAHICPDMALALLAAPPLSPVDLTAPATFRRAADLPAPILARGAEAPRPTARGPPPTA